MLEDRPKDQLDMGFPAPRPERMDITGIALKAEPPLAPYTARLLPILTALVRLGRRELQIQEICEIAGIGDGVVIAALVELSECQISAEQIRANGHNNWRGVPTLCPEPNRVLLQPILGYLADFESAGLNIVRPFLDQQQGVFSPNDL